MPGTTILGIRGDGTLGPTIHGAGPHTVRTGQSAGVSTLGLTSLGDGARHGVGGPRGDGVPRGDGAGDGRPDGITHGIPVTDPAGIPDMDQVTAPV